jgi:hypothetical protein
MPTTVHITDNANQTISGVKTFVSGVIAQNLSLNDLVGGDFGVTFKLNDGDLQVSNKSGVKFAINDLSALPYTGFNIIETTSNNTTIKLPPNKNDFIAMSSEVVYKTGNQTISGVKTFNLQPILSGNPLITGVDLSSYITTSQTGNFYAKSNPSGFITGVDLSSYITTSQTGNFYAKSNPSGFITGVNLSSYITTSQTGNFYSTSNPSGFITGVNLSSYITTSQTGNFYSTSNPSGFITGISNIVYNTGAQTISGIKTFFDSGIFSNGGVSAVPLLNNPLSIVGSGNNYVQLNIQNRATGLIATADLVITANNGTDNSNFINLGINNSGYSDPLYNNTTGLDGYLIMDGGDLDIGTRTPGKIIEFHAGGTTESNVIARISESGFNLVSGNLTVTGGSIFNNEFPYINKLPAASDLITTPYVWFSNGNNANTSIALAGQSLFLMPVWISTNCTIVSGGSIMNLNSGAVDIDCGLYGANTNGLPDTRVAYVRVTGASTLAGDVLIGSTGPTVVRRGMYWGAVMSYTNIATGYQSAAGAMTTMTNLQPTIAGLDRILPLYKDLNGHLITNISAGTRIPTTLAGTRKLNYVTASASSTEYRSRQTAPFVFFVPQI